MALRRPIRIGKYDVVDLLGKGGMGVVYKATDPILGRPVAIKMMTMVDYVDNPDLLQRFYREAQSTGNLHHRNIVTIYELGDQEGSPYLVMEYLEGQTLDAVIQSARPLSVLDKINFIIEVCDGLAYAHQRSIVHRDIKPGNIMVLKDGGVKIVDFGIAHIGNRTVTRTGQLLGSLPYMSPEQISGKQVDGRTDIFSLGAVLYQVLTSHLPFEGETPAATLLKIMHEPPRPLSEYKESFPPELDSIILRALAKDREERYPSAQDFAFDLAQVRARIQLEMVEEHLNEAEALLLKQELFKAKEALTQVLRIDRHNTRAVELLRTTQQHIQQQEVGEQVRQLRRQAEEAYENEQFVVALDLIQKAFSLHSTDPDLQRFRANVQQAKNRAEQLQGAIQRAESAYKQRELDSAKQAIEEALRLAPDRAEVKVLHEKIQRDWAQRAQRLQIHNLIEEARKEIASRNFTLAIEVLRKAEALDPDAPQLRALIGAAQAAREQEQRRKALENIKREIEADLDRDDFQVACSRAQAALQDFPDDRGLQKLADLAAKQRSLAERKYFIDEQVARARNLLEAGRTEEVLDILQSAQEKVGGDPHLDSLLVVVRETLERQRIESRKAEYLRRSKDLLRRKDYAEAIRTLEAAQSEFGTNAEIDDLLQFTIEQSKAEKSRQIAEAAAAKAQALIQDQDYDKAVEVLESALREAADEELRIILVQARHAAADHRKLLQDALANAESMIQGQRPIEALKYLQSQPASFSREPRFAELAQKAEQQAERLKQIGRELEKARVHLGRDEFDRARSVLDDCVRTYGRTIELNKLVSEIEERQMQLAAETLEKVLSQGRKLIMDGKPEAALQELGVVQTIIGMVPPKLSQAYKALQQDAANAQAKKYRSEAEKLLAEGEHSQAAAILERAHTEFPQSRELQQLRKTLEQAMRRRAEAQNLLARADDSFQRGSWREGADQCLHAGPLSNRDPVTRKAILSKLEAAAAAAVEADWREGEFLLHCMAQLQPNAVLPAGVEEKIAQGKREERVQQCLAQADELQSRGDLDKALRVVEDELTASARDARLSSLQQRLQQLRRERDDQARLERERKERAAYVLEIQHRLQRESSPEGAMRLLEEALRVYPNEETLEKELASVQTLSKKIAALAEQARTQEESRNYGRAMQTWQSIRELGIDHPEFEGSITRLRQSQQEASSAIRAAWLRAIRDSLAAFNLPSATNFLADAQSEFPNDQELNALGKSRDKILKQREESLRLLSEAQELVRNQEWQQAVKLLGRCAESAGPDMTLSGQLVSALLEASRSALPAKLDVAQILLDRAAEIQPDSREVAEMRLIVQQQELEEIVSRRLADAQAIAEAGNAQRALDNINQALSSHPDEPRFLARKRELERDIQSENEGREKQKKLLEILDAAQNLRAEGNLSASLQKVKEGLSAFPVHPQFVQMKTAVENAIREDEYRKQEAERQRLLVEQERKRKEEERQRRELEARQKQEQKLKEEEAKRAAESEKQRLLMEQEKKRNEEQEKQRRELEAKQEKERQLKEQEKKAAEQQAALLRKQQEQQKLKNAERRREQERKISQVPGPTEQPQSSKDHETQVWRGSALPVEATQPSPASANLQKVPAVAARKATVPQQTAPSKSLKLYATAAALLIGASILGSIVWQRAHKSTPRAITTVPVEILTNPSGASVHVKDSDLQCVTPQCTLNLSPGKHELQVELPGYQTLTQSISVGPESSTPVALSLTPLSATNEPGRATKASQLARLELRDAQPGAEVLVDQQQKGKVNRRGTFSTELPPGDHEIRWTARNRVSGTIVRNFSSGSRIELSSSDLVAPKVSAATPPNPPNPPLNNPPPNKEEAEWQRIKDSNNLGEVDQFLRRYPHSAFAPQAEAKLDDLDWAGATSSNTLSAYSQYAGKFPQGKHVQQAQEQISKLEWQSLEKSSDPAALESFVKKHPSGTYHDQALLRLDDLNWEHTRQNDVSSLRAYIQNSPGGRHAGEAQKRIAELTRPAVTARATEPHIPEAPPVDDKKLIAGVLAQYQKAYEKQDIQELQRIWPSMTGQQVNGLRDFFAHVSGVTLDYRVIGQPQIEGDHATVTFQQSLAYVLDGKNRKGSAKVVVQLNKQRGAPGVWRIDSIR